MTLQERLKTLGARDIFLVVLFVISLPVAVLSLLELIDWKDSAEANPFHLCAHWTTLATLLLGAGGPFVLFMVGRRSLVFAYVCLFAAVHLFVYVLFWTWLAPSPHLGFGSTVARLLLVSVPPAALASAIYFAGTSRPAGPRTAFLTRWKGVGGATACLVLLALSYHRLTLQEHHLLDGHLYRASVKLEAGEFDAALQELGEYLRRRPDDHDVHIHLGRVKEKKGDLEGALAEYTLAVKGAESAGVESPRAYFNRGLLRGKMGDLEGSFSDYTEAIYADENDGTTCPRDSEFWIAPMAFYNRGVVRLREGNSDGAATNFREVLELSTNAELVEKANNALEMIERRDSWMLEQEVW